MIPFNLGEFDFILSMDWLTSCEARIDCKDKKARIRLSGSRLLCFMDGSKLRCS